MKRFIEEKHPLIKVSLNFHSFGDFWIMPYNFLKDDSEDSKNSELKKEPIHYKIY